MVVNLHFQFANQEPVTLSGKIENHPGGRRFHVGDNIWIDQSFRRKIRDAYKRAFHRRLTNTFTFHFGKGPNELGRRFNYNSKTTYRLKIPPGRYKHFWTNGRFVRIARRDRNEENHPWM
jgi:hypothetical protein